MNTNNISFEEVNFSIKKVTDVSSSMSPFRMTDCTVSLSKLAEKKLADIYRRYNNSFTDICQSNMENEEDYRFNYFGRNKKPINHIVQIDINGGSADIKSIFEIENSVAMYQLLSRLNPVFYIEWRRLLSHLKMKTGKPIALAAVTKEKFKEMLEMEFGYKSYPGDDVIKRLSGGFELFAGPERLLDMYNNGKLSDYAWYIRASSPKKTLRNPRLKSESVLYEKGVRSILKRNALTFNVDKPESTFEESINDTKAYMGKLGIGYTVNNISDVFIDGRLTDSLKEFLSTYPQDTVLVRAKPQHLTYGCYGHLRLNLLIQKHRRKLKEAIKKRGPYIIQPELPQKVVLNKEDGKIYTYIDRIFFSWIDGPCFAGGFRSFIPLDTEEAKNGRNHGNGSTVWMPII